MIKQFFSLVLLLSFSMQALANPVSNMQIKNVMTKYDFMLTSHPQAHEEEFQKQAIESFKSELKNVLGNLSESELQANYEQLLNELPTQEQRDSFALALVNSSEAEVAQMLSTPDKLQEILRGESSNFFNEDTAAPIVLLTLFVALGVLAIIEAISRSKYEWFETNVGSQPLCRNVTQSEKDAGIAAMMTRCQNEATHPETCRVHSYGSTQTYSGEDHHGPYTYERCRVSVKAAKELD